MVKDRIKDFVLSLGVDDVGIAATADYRSPRSPALETILPGVKSLVVLTFKELSNCRSENLRIAMGGRLDTMEFMRSCNFRTARFLERELGATAMTVPPSYPLNMSLETRGTVADVSLRHAAVAAGLGNFGRHNIVIHPDLGTTVLFTAILTNLELESDPPVTEELCDNCNICVESCPAGALDVEGRTDDMKCLRQSQPYGLGRMIRFWMKYTDSEAEEQKRMLMDVEFWRLYQASFIGFQYFCFNCYTGCPIGKGDRGPAT
jgi:epoxyqueuosine reductase